MNSASAEKLLEQLVGFPTVSTQPNEELIQFAHDRLRACGATLSILRSRWRADGWNLHGVLGPEVEGGILLAAHTDVVAVEGQRWTSDPFRLRYSGERMYGRGTADMKGFIAATLAAVAAHGGRGLRRPLHLALSCDEEVGCKGVESLLEALATPPINPALCVIGEPTLMRIADRHKGKVSLRFTLGGRAAHSSAPARGVNAVAWAGRLITQLSDLADELAEGPGDEAFAVPHPTLSLGPVQGGVSLNIVPDRCTLEVELRYPPGYDPSPLLETIRNRADGLAALMQERAPEAGIQIDEMAAYPPLPPNSRGLAAMQALGVDGPAMAVDFGTEAGYYQYALGAPCVVFGPGDMAVAHRADEYLERQQLHFAEAFVATVLQHLSEDPRAT